MPGAHRTRSLACKVRTHASKSPQGVTGKVYNHAKRMKEKRTVLDGVAAELQRTSRSAPSDGS
jgi:hypothetical protein